MAAEDTVLDYFDLSSLEALNGQTIAEITYTVDDTEESGACGFLTITTTYGRTVVFETRDDYSKLSWLVATVNEPPCYSL